VACDPFGSTSLATHSAWIQPLLRVCLTIVAVAVLSAGLAYLRDAQGQRSEIAQPQHTAWIRTVDGWEPSTVLQVKLRPAAAPPLHPALVASLQLGLSFFALLAASGSKSNPV